MTTTHPRCAILPPLDAQQRYSISEACAYLRISRGQLYRELAAGRIGRLKAGTRTYIPGSEIIRLSTLDAR
ncbi:hypothetical protein BH24PSE2_BH24PSE2_15500 [soil metagenome]